MRGVSRGSHGALTDPGYRPAIAFHDPLPTPARRATDVAAGAAGAIVCAHLAAEALVGALGVGGGTAAERVRGLVDLNGERNVPAVASALLLAACAALWVLCGRDARRRGRPHAGRWTVLGIVFAGLALDELMELHERLIEPTRAVTGAWGPLHFAWIVPYGLAVAALALAFRSFLAALAPGLRRRLTLAGAVYVGGALGLEAVGGVLASDGRDRALAVVQAVEETAELTGLVILAGALVGALAPGPPADDQAMRGRLRRRRRTTPPTRGSVSA